MTARSDQSDPILTIAEVSRELRCSKAHVSGLIRGEIRGVPQLPVLSLGRRKLVRRSSLEKWKSAAEAATNDGMLLPSPRTDAGERAKEL